VTGHFGCQQFRPAELLAAFRRRKIPFGETSIFARQESARRAGMLAVFLLPSVRNSYDMSRNRPAQKGEKNA